MQLPFLLSLYEGPEQVIDSLRDLVNASDKLQSHLYLVLNYLRLLQCCQNIGNV